MFADDILLLSFVHDKYVSRDELNSDLRKMSDWAFQWKMKFYPYLNKQAQEVNFLKRINKEFFFKAFTNCVHGYDRARNVHANSVTCERKFVHGIERP